ncbi:MAG: Biopolymer transport protein ExbD [Syntrophorhabdaceae bacterium PtaU1.Bin034]|jgi:biopolymer transport protein ExbD|nr:MAG: Biopolymer transport protein ExbD [Syntrophorhabdaceae bacterium PtaU1.Bin034]
MTGMDEKEFDYINMIPFIDVMLVLLTIVLTTSTFVATGIIPVELPKVAGKHEAATVAQVVGIDREGTVFYQGKPVNLSDLKARIAAMPRETPFLIRADKDIHLQGFVEVLDLIKAAGFRKVSLQTEWLGQ